MAGYRLLRELRRRNVFRAGTFYAAFAWLIVQVATQVFPFFGIPNWVVRWIVIAAVIGFPFVLAFAWYYELTPDGFRRDSDVQPARSIRHLTGKRLDRGIIAALCLIVVLLLANTFVLHHDDNATPDKSVAVLPLLDESGDQGGQYFSDGISEDLISMLGQVPDLKVIGRNSSFRFRGDAGDGRDIGAKLGVATLLEGTVRRQGDSVRIFAELIRAEDGRLLWSQSYERGIADIFSVQREIAEAVASALQATLGSKPIESTDKPPSGDLAAYNAYLQGNFYVARSTEKDDRTAIAHYQEAVRIDPNYARAYAALSNTWTAMAGAFLDGVEMQQAYTNARRAADTALALNPDLATGHSARGHLMAWADFDWHNAATEYRRALQLAPNSGSAASLLAGLTATLGDPAQAAQLQQRALSIDPLYATWYETLAEYYSALGRLDDATRAINKAIELQPGGASFHQTLTVIEIQRGDATAALNAARQGPQGAWQDVAVTMALQVGEDRAAADAALQGLIAKDGDGYAYQIAEIYALRKDPDHAFEWLDRAWTNRDSGIAYLLFDPLLLAYKHDPRFAAFCKKVGLPVPGGMIAAPASTVAHAATSSP